MDVRFNPGVTLDVIAKLVEEAMGAPKAPPRVDSLELDTVTLVAQLIRERDHYKRLAEMFAPIRTRVRASLFGDRVRITTSERPRLKPPWAPPWAVRLSVGRYTAAITGVK